MTHGRRDVLARYFLAFVLVVPEVLLASCGPTPLPGPRLPEQNWCHAIDDWTASLGGEGAETGRFQCLPAPGRFATGDFGRGDDFSAGRLQTCASSDSWRTTRPTAMTQFQYEGRTQVEAGGALSLPFAGGGLRLGGGYEGTSEVRFVVTLRDAQWVQVQSLEQAVAAPLRTGCTSLCSSNVQLVSEAIEARLEVAILRADGSDWEAGVTIGQDPEGEGDGPGFHFGAESSAGSRSALRLSTSQPVTVAFRTVASRSRLTDVCRSSGRDFTATWGPAPHVGIRPATRATHELPAPPDTRPGDLVDVRVHLVSLTMDPSQPSEHCSGNNDAAQLRSELAVEVGDQTHPFRCESGTNAGCGAGGSHTFQVAVDGAGNIPLALQVGQCACENCVCGFPHSCSGVVRVTATSRD